MMPHQFIWQLYDMTSQYITELPPYCSPQLWTSTCPLIFYARVEMHHSERVFRQFGMIQNIPPFLQDRDTELHRFDPHHIQYISVWIRRFETIVRKPLIRDTVTRDGYDKWYDRVTHHFISPANKVQTPGYQVGDASLMQFLADQLTSFNISARMRPLEDLTAANSLLERYISVGEQAATLLVSRDLPSEQPQPPDDTQTTINRRRRGRTQRSSSSVEGDTTSRTQILPFTGHASTSYHCPPAADVAGPSTLFVSSDDVYRPVPVSEDYFPFTPYDPTAYTYSQVQLNIGLRLMPENVSRPEFNISSVPFPPMTSMYRNHIHDTSSSTKGNRNRRPRGCGTGGHY
ncbi:hypothetical protein Pfo_010009 [Paulownia fortunei]|nr:hypothetical protein Pfo_010009 [Paulownia fortunei]